VRVPTTPAKEGAMPNHNYTRGRAAEYRSMRLLEGEGYQTMRAAGSHGVFDIIGWNEAAYKMVQVKLETPPSRSELETMADTIVPPNAQKLIHVWKKVKGKVVLMVTVVALLVLASAPLLSGGQLTSNWRVRQVEADDLD
jgi:Holliday junction resolvase